MKNNTNEIYDILIIGAGPGGMTAAIYAARAMANIAMIEKGAPGGKVTKTSEIENYPGFDSIQGYELAMKMFDQTQKLKITYIADRVTTITKQDNLFKLELFSKKIFISKSCYCCNWYSWTKIRSAWRIRIRRTWSFILCGLWWGII
ncbi:NAD(P)/FAD-dependent oxidoreductase [Spiroplasma citri]|uniref:NAD(P)/FAD-dependent oxidoreductase n=1 Tax=Spiroplasma citri TaxID=2133 RepID=UPI0020A4E178|nr:FAD-dependent oxidoreductase [Spiroplasma citri]